MSEERAPFGVVHGGRDLVEQLEDALARVKDGELKAVIIVGLTVEGYGWTGAYVDGTPWFWPRMQTALEVTRADFLDDGVEEWS